jgi:hypothetical protein
MGISASFAIASREYSIQSLARSGGWFLLTESSRGRRQRMQFQTNGVRSAPSKLTRLRKPCRVRADEASSPLALRECRVRRSETSTEAARRKVGQHARWAASAAARGNMFATHEGLQDG